MASATINGVNGHNGGLNGECVPFAVRFPNGIQLNENGMIDYGSWSRVTVVLGAQWGDEGKGKIVDLMASEMDVVCRCQVSHTM